MADCKPLFRILNDNATGEGQAPDARIEGEAAASQEGLIGFSFKDSSGNVVLPQLTSTGKIQVDTEGDETVCKSAYGTNAGSLTFVDLATYVATLSKVHKDFEINVASTQESLFQLVYVDDVGGAPTETVLGTFIVGAGQYTVCCSLHCSEVDTTGGTGTQHIKIKGKNLFKTCDMYASLNLEEVQ